MRGGGLRGGKFFFRGGITWFSTYGNGRESVVASRVLRGGTVILKIDCQLIVNEGDCQNVTEP